MEGSITKELYSESSKISNDLLGPSQVNHNHRSDLHGEVKDDGLFWCSDNEELDSKESDLQREWEKRRQQFHKIGYRDGLLAGKEASAQEGFNVGFKESVLVGYRWGQVRGITSAFSCLPDGLKEKLNETQEKRDQFQGFCESVNSLSTMDALKMYHDELTAKKMAENEHANTSLNSTDMVKDSSECSSNKLEDYTGKLQSMLVESPAIKSHLSEK